jgi:Zn finger protein HypA/HybF involved in hydrogenase expression
MHDLLIIQDVCRKVEDIAREHGAEKVIRVVLEVGGISHHSSAQLQEAFQTFREISPLLRGTEIEFRESGNQDDDVFLRDVELEITESGDG